VGLFEQKTIQNQSCFFLVVPRERTAQSYKSPLAVYV
jgi:hypothetical protein